ncbi:putative dynamin-related protein 4A [Rutidosis leptorrhynchoides]|uniref:putative dynamin-related protein 4A n=1 Tax=Rutidosis leptorrhynchoides TaxID=125765 RepID=UPI003A9A0D61
MLLDSEPNLPPLIKHFSEKFKQPLHLIKKLGYMDVIDTNYSLPKIIVVGDAGIGKTSLISTLVGLSLPQGLQIPLGLKFEIHSSPCTKLYLGYQYQYESVKEEVSEADLGSKVLAAAKLLPENKTSDVSISLTVMQPYVSDLTIVDLPGINPNLDKYRLKKEFEVLEGYIWAHARYEECAFLIAYRL